MITTAHRMPAAVPAHPTGVRRTTARSLLVLWGLLTFFATLDHQPDVSSRFLDWSAFVTTDRFLVGHLVGSIIGQAVFVLAAAAIVGTVLADTTRPRHAVAGFALAVLGSAGLLAGFGTAALAQPAIGRLGIVGDPGAHALYDDVYGPVAMVTLVGGAVVFASGTVLSAWAVAATPGSRRCRGVRPRCRRTTHRGRGHRARGRPDRRVGGRGAGRTVPVPLDAGQSMTTVSSGVPRNAARRAACSSIAARSPRRSRCHGCSVITSGRPWSSAARCPALAVDDDGTGTADHRPQLLAPGGVVDEQGAVAQLQVGVVRAEQAEHAADGRARRGPRSARTKRSAPSTVTGSTSSGQCSVTSRPWCPGTRRRRRASSVRRSAGGCGSGRSAPRVAGEVAVAAAPASPSPAGAPGVTCRPAARGRPAATQGGTAARRGGWRCTAGRSGRMACPARRSTAGRRRL